MVLSYTSTSSTSSSSKMTQQDTAISRAYQRVVRRISLSKEKVIDTTRRRSLSSMSSVDDSTSNASHSLNVGGHNNSGGGNGLTSPRLTLAEQGFPHMHVKQKQYDGCKRTPKHNVEEFIPSCKCGKEAIDTFREFCNVENGNCWRCVEEESQNSEAERAFDGF